MPPSLLIRLLFFPAILGVLGQVIWGSDRSHQLLALGIFLMGFEQAHMAIVDLGQIAIVQQHLQDSRLTVFRWVTQSTIVIELAGFYSAILWPGWGALLILLSQVWFNCLARIQLQPDAECPIQPWGVHQRRSVLLADGIGLIFLSLWIAHIAALWISISLLGLVLVYSLAKYAITPLVTSPRP